jgi:predicted transcriptional regulator
MLYILPMNRKPIKLRKTETLVLRVAPDMLKRLDRIASADFEARSATVRRALEAGLRQLEGKKRP